MADQRVDPVHVCGSEPSNGGKVGRAAGVGLGRGHGAVVASYPTIIKRVEG
jgi:hypothetical protein